MSIKMTNITKSFGNKGENKINVLNNINLKIEDNEMIAIMGRSGAGKSTLLHIIGCLDKADSGEYYLDEQNVLLLSSSRLSEYRNSKFGFIMQDFALIEDETAKHNIELPLIFSKNKTNISYNKIVESLGIYNLLNKKVSLLSG